MNVTQYLYQSPSSSSVQFGRVDPSTKQDSANFDTSKTNETLQKAETLSATQTQEVKPSVENKPLLDVYA